MSDLDDMRRFTKGKREGWLYALECASLPGILKIGHTRERPEDRAREYNLLTGIVLGLAKFEIAWGMKVHDSSLVEKRVHAVLAPSRVRDDREFFRVTVDELCDAVEKVVWRKVPREPWVFLPTPRGAAKERRRLRFRIYEFYDWLVEHRTKLIGVEPAVMVDAFYAGDMNTYRGRPITEIYALMEWRRVQQEFGITQPEFVTPR